jgi:hypothetical protein
MRAGQNAQRRARYAQLSTSHFVAGRQIVHQEAVCIRRQGMRDGGALAGIVKGECGIGGGIGANFTPFGRFCCPSRATLWDTSTRR